MATKTYKVIPRTPQRGIGDRIIDKEGLYELNELEAYKVLKSGNLLQTEDGKPVLMSDFTGEKEEQIILQKSVLSADNTNGDASMLRNACKVVGHPNTYENRSVDLSKPEVQDPVTNDSKDASVDQN